MSRDDARKEAAGGRGQGPGKRTALIGTLAEALRRPPGDLDWFTPAESGRIAEQFDARWRAAARSLDPERALETSTSDRLVVESLLAWLAARLPQLQLLVIVVRRGPDVCAVRTRSPEALLHLHEAAAHPGDVVQVMSPDGAFGIALRNGDAPAPAAPIAAGAPAGTHFRLFVWGAPR